MGALASLMFVKSMAADVLASWMSQDACSAIVPLAPLFQWAARSVCAAAETRPQTTRSTSIFFTSAMALAGFRPLGQTWAQFMMVWQR